MGCFWMDVGAKHANGSKYDIGKNNKINKSQKMQDAPRETAARLRCNLGQSQEQDAPRETVVRLRCNHGQTQDHPSSQVRVQRHPEVKAQDDNNNKQCCRQCSFQMTMRRKEEQIVYFHAGNQLWSQAINGRVNNTMCSSPTSTTLSCEWAPESH